MCPQRLRRLALALAVVLPWMGALALPALAGASTPVGRLGELRAPGPEGPTGTVPPSVRRWGIAPTAGTAEQPGERPFFSYQVAPGSVVRDSVTVWNPSGEPLALRTYAQDAINGPSGALDLRTADQAPTDVGAWVQLDNEQVVVPPRSGVPISFTVTVPPSSAPGDHTGGIVAVLAGQGSGSDGKNVVVDNRVGARLYVRVLGPVNPALEIDRLETDYRGVVNPIGGGELAVTYTVRNAGNTRLQGEQSVRVQAPFGWSLQERQLEPLPELLPGSTYTRTEVFTGVPQVLRVTAELQVTPTGGRGAPAEPAEPVVRSASSWAVPWVLVVALIGAAVGGAVARRRRRARRSTSALPDAVEEPRPRVPS